MSAGAAARQPPQEGARPWTAGPPDPALPPATLDVWRVDLAATGEEVIATLNALERERAADIAGARGGALWRRSRGVLRTLLGRYLHADPGSLELTAGAHGKPQLASVPGDRALHFNLSHSGELALYAFAADSVGVDVQKMHEPSRRGRTDHLALTARVSGAQAAARLELLSPEPREVEFLRLWTRHEAALKQQGLGIGAGDRARAQRPAWIAELDVGRHASAAVACACVPGELRLWDWGGA